MVNNTKIVELTRAEVIKLLLEQLKKQSNEDLEDMLNASAQQTIYKLKT